MKVVGPVESGAVEIYSTDTSWKVYPGGNFLDISHALVETRTRRANWTGAVLVRRNY